MADRGYVLIHRRIFDNPAFRNKSEAMAFACLVTMAAWSPVRLKYKGVERTLERGQLMVSVRDFAAQWGATKDWVQRFFERLEKAGMISRQPRQQRDSSATASATAPNLITICNYSKYQPTENGSATAGDTLPATLPATQNKERKEINTLPFPLKSEKREKDAREIFSLPDWVPREAWDGWIEMRRKKRATPTDRAKMMIVRKLERLRAQGHDPGKLLDRATVRGWLDVFPDERGTETMASGRQPITL